MAKRYKYAPHLARKIDDVRSKKGLSYNALAALSRVDISQVYRICKTKDGFKTLNPSVLKICKILDIVIDDDTVFTLPATTNQKEAEIAAAAIGAWDRTEEGAIFIKSVLKAIGKQKRHRQMAVPE